jgi:hypothetical protein
MGSKENPNKIRNLMNIQIDINGRSFCALRSALLVVRRLTPADPSRGQRLFSLRTWLLKIVEGRHGCWDGFLKFGTVSAGHDDPPGPPLKRLSVGEREATVAAACVH